MADVVSHADNDSLFHELINVLIGLEEKIVIVDCLLVVEITPNEPKTRLGIFLVAYITFGFNSYQGENMAVHILEPNIQKHISSQPPNVTDEDVENDPARQKALAELKDIFDGYNKEINEYNELELKRFEEETKREKEKENKKKIENEIYNKKIRMLCDVLNESFNSIELLKDLKTAL
jgi:hypothetical protein